MKPKRVKKKVLTAAEIAEQIEKVVNIKDWTKGFIKRFEEYDYYSFLAKYVEFKVKNNGVVELDIRKPIPISELPVNYMAVKYSLVGEIPSEIKKNLNESIELLVSEDNSFCLVDGVWGADFLSYKIFFVSTPFQNPEWYKQLPFEKLEYVHLDLGILFNQIFRGINVPKKLSLV